MSTKKFALGFSYLIFRNIVQESWLACILYFAINKTFSKFVYLLMLGAGVHINMNPCNTNK